MAKRTARKTKKKTAKKAARRPAARKTTAKKSAPAKRAPISSAKGKPRSKSEVCATIADHVGISKKEVAAVFETMGAMIEADLKKGAAGTFNVPGLMKVVVQRKPAT